MRPPPAGQYYSEFYDSEIKGQKKRLEKLKERQEKRRKEREAYFAAQKK